MYTEGLASNHSFYFSPDFPSALSDYQSQIALDLALLFLKSLKEKKFLSKTKSFYEIYDKRGQFAKDGLVR